MEKTFETLITSYIDNNIGIATNFLSADLCKHLKENILNLHQQNQMKTAGIGNDDKLIFNDTIRKDVIYWLDRSHNNEYENAFFDKIDAFVAYLNQTCYTNINSYEFHYSLYQPGSFYKPHFDQFEDNSDRQFSMISYLNPNWTDSDGGELKIYQELTNDIISPNQGKTVFFKSQDLKHEVLETHQPRFSVTGWLKRG
jgi:SM-20-related protein